MQDGRAAELALASSVYDLLLLDLGLPGKEGRMAAESKDSEKVYQDKQAVKGEKKNIAADKANLKADQKK